MVVDLIRHINRVLAALKAKALSEHTARLVCVAERHDELIALAHIKALCHRAKGCARGDIDSVGAV